MANPEHVKIVKQGRDAIRAWRIKNLGTQLNLVEADLTEVNLSGILLTGVSLSGADLQGADLSGSDLTGADLSYANLFGVDLNGTDLSGANLQEANLWWANLFGADLSGCNVEGAKLFNTAFADVNLSEVRGLESVAHEGPCSIGVDTLYKSQGKIPEAFLRGCGVPEDLITYLPSLIGAMEPIQFQSCFISYSSKDDEFARRLYGRMRGEKLRVWFAPEDMQGGKKSIEQIDRAIQVNDRLLLVLSKHSMNSEWVRREIKRARATERAEKRTKLFPIALAPFTMIKKWCCDDADTGEDLAEKIREYHIPDFSNWKDHDGFEAAFADLLRDLRAEA